MSDLVLRGVPGPSAPSRLSTDRSSCFIPDHQGWCSAPAEGEASKLFYKAILIFFFF